MFSHPPIVIEWKNCNSIFMHDLLYNAMNISHTSCKLTIFLLSNCHIILYFLLMGNVRPSVNQVF